MSAVRPEVKDTVGPFVTQSSLVTRAVGRDFRLRSFSWSHLHQSVGSFTNHCWTRQSKPWP